MLITKNCPKCGDEFTHEPKYNHEKKFCSRKCSNGRTWSEEDKLKKSIASRTTHSKRIKVKIPEKVYEFKCPHCPNTVYRPWSDVKVKKYCTRDCMHQNRIHGGQWKGIYQGIKYDSSYELTYLVYCLENNIQLERAKRSFSYVYEGKDRKYYPDFYLPATDEYVEIKGETTDLDLAKWKQFSEKLIVLTQKELSPYLNYCVKKYGESFWRLPQFGSTLKKYRLE